MRKLIFLLLLLIPFISNATTYYVSPTGSDGAPGSLLQPFKTVEKLASVLHAGDVGFVRGGLYQSVKGNGADVHFAIDGLTGSSGSPILIYAYPGEVPMFDCSNTTPTNMNPFIMVVSNCNYVNFRGFVVKNLKQINDGSGVSRGLEISHVNNCIIEQFNIYDIGGTGMVLDVSNNNLILNCDFHNNGDGRSPDQWNFGDGWADTGNDTSSGNTISGCRIWMNGDDGMDWFGWQGSFVTVVNCWSFWNSIKPWGLTGTQPNEDSITPSNPALWAGNNAWRTSTTSGEGFKMGGCNLSPLTCHTGGMTTLRKRFINCVSFDNSGTGYSFNFTEGPKYSHIMAFENCISYHNGNDGWGGASGRNIGLKQRFHNCWAYGNNTLDSGGDFAYDGLCDSIAFNIWNTFYDTDCGNLKPGLTINNSDFVSVAQTGVTGARQSDGRLPVLTFLHLAGSSELIDAGIERGYGNDLGAFQFNTTALPTANAGANQPLILPANSVTLTGVGTGTSITTLWSKISGPAATITSASSATTTVTGLVKGVYQFEFKVTDGSMNVARDTMIVNVDEETPVVPTGVIMRSVTINRNGKAVVTWDSDATANSFVYIVQHKERLGYRQTGTSTPAVIGTKTYKGTYAAVKGDNYYMVCPVDLKGKPPCSAAMMVKKN